MNSDAIENVWRVNKLHRELAHMYYTKSKDSKRIGELWREIERVEALLRLDNVEGPWN